MYDQPEIPGARNTDPVTSHAGAEDVKVRAGSQRAKMLNAFAYLVEATDEEAMERAPGISLRSCWWKRASELRQGGYIEDTGETRIGSQGSARMVSRITSKGIAAAVVSS